MKEIYVPKQPENTITIHESDVDKGIIAAKQITNNNTYIFGIICRQNMRDSYYRICWSDGRCSNFFSSIESLMLSQKDAKFHQL